jgi:hypothetical protein
MKRATAKETAAAIPIPALAKGEHYAGILLHENGTPSHHLVLLGATSEKNLTWKDALAWAKKQGGDLPTRREQSLLMANAKQHIESLWHWSSEQHTDDSGDAWYQTFDNGNQYWLNKANKRRVRAVRRVPL